MKMPDFKLLKVQYLKLRESIIKYLDQFDEESYFYQPTIKSNATAWIIPHISAFEKLMVIDKIEGYNFGIFISQEEIEKYKWIESEKAGIDIGWERASTEWLDRHFPAWKRNNWQRAVREALEAETSWN